MFNSLSQHIAGFLFRQKCFEKSLMPVYVYGIEVLISSLTGVFLVLLAGLATGNFINSVIFLVSFIFLRLYTGGLHCNSYILCNIFTTLSFIIVVLINNAVYALPESPVVYCGFSVISFLITLIFAPVSNPNKEVSQNQKYRYRLVSMCILILHFLLYAVFCTYKSAGIIVTTDIIACAYIIIGLIKNKIERSISDENQKEHS